MFGFKRRAAKREAERAENLTIVRQAVRTRLDDKLQAVIASLPILPYLANNTVDALTAKVKSVRAGFDAVLINGVDAYGPELAGADESMKAGAMVAQAACNMAVLGGTLDDPNTLGDIFYVLGFTRDGSQLREDTVNPTANAAQPTSPSHAGIFGSMQSAISRIIEDTRTKARAYLAEVQAGRHVFPETPTKRIAAARKFVQNSTVGSAALCVWDATIHYHAWCKREDWSKWNEIGVSDVADQSDLLPNSSGFRWGDHSWMFTLENTGPSYSRDMDLGKFRVTVDGELVMELAVAKGYREFDEWYETDVCALTVGPWASTLVEMWAELELAKQRRRTETETARLEEQASRIKLS